MNAAPSPLGVAKNRRGCRQAWKVHIIERLLISGEGEMRIVNFVLPVGFEARSGDRAGVLAPRRAGMAVCLILGFL